MEPTQSELTMTDITYEENKNHSDPRTEYKPEYKKVVIECEGRQVEVEISKIDFSEGKKDAPLEISAQGFGQGVEGVSEFDDMLIEGEARKLKANFVRVRIKNIPPPYDDKSDKSKPPSFGVDARIILEALGKDAVDVLGRPVIVSGYSEGAGVAIAIAGEVDKLQKEKSQEDTSSLPSNKLRLWSLTSTMDLDPKARGTTVFEDFTKEVSTITLIEMVDRYNKITGKQVGVSNKLEAYDFLDEFAKFCQNPLNWPKVLGEVWDARKKNLPMLFGVLGRVIPAVARPNGKEYLLEQLKKMETRSPVCDQLGANWEAKIVVPRNDSLYPWSKVRRTIRSLQKNTSKTVEVLSPDTPGNFDPDVAIKLSDLAAKYLFPNVGKAEFKIIGESKTFIGEKGDKKGLGLGQVHAGPENDPKAYFEASSFAGND